MGNIQFRNGKILFTAAPVIAMDADCCCSHPCNACIDGKGPVEFQVVIDGVVQHDPACATDPLCDCVGYNGTYILTGSSSCRWVYQIAHYFPSEWICLRIYTSGADVVLDVIISQLGACNYSVFYGALWRKIYADAATIDCKSLSSESIPFFNSLHVYCDFSSATCLVSAI